MNLHYQLSPFPFPYSTFRLWIDDCKHSTTRHVSKDSAKPEWLAAKSCSEMNYLYCNHTFCFLLRYCTVYKVYLPKIFCVFLAVSLSESSNHISCCARSTHRRCSVRKGVLANVAKFTGKQLCQSLFFNKVARLWCLKRFYERLNF